MRFVLYKPENKDIAASGGLLFCLSRKLWYRMSFGLKLRVRKLPRHTFPQRPKLASDVCTKCGMVDRVETMAYPYCYGAPW